MESEESGCWHLFGGNLFHQVLCVAFGSTLSAANVFGHSVALFWCALIPYANYEGLSKTPIFFSISVSLSEVDKSSVSFLVSFLCSSHQAGLSFSLPPFLHSFQLYSRYVTYNIV